MKYQMMCDNWYACQCRRDNAVQTVTYFEIFPVFICGFTPTLLHGSQHQQHCGVLNKSQRYTILTIEKQGFRMTKIEMKRPKRLGNQGICLNCLILPSSRMMMLMVLMMIYCCRWKSSGKLHCVFECAVPHI